MHAKPRCDPPQLRRPPLQRQRMRCGLTKRLALRAFAARAFEFPRLANLPVARVSIRCRLGKRAGAGDPDAASRCARENGDDLGLRCLSFFPDDQPPSVGIFADDLPASMMQRRRVINHFLEFDPQASGSVGTGEFGRGTANANKN